MNRKDGTGFTHCVEKITLSRLGCIMALVGTGRAISVLFGINGLRNKTSHLLGPVLKSHFSAISLNLGCV